MERKKSCHALEIYLLDSINTHSSYHTFKKTLKLFLLNNTLTYRLN